MYLLRHVELYLRTSGQSATRFGKLVANDPRFVFDLRRGREVGPKLTARVKSFLSDQTSAEAGR
jgi:hypothetical protein